MPVTPTYPGVYIEELPSTNHTIVGVATSITAFVGYTKRGPVDEPTEVNSFGEFERIFGSLDPECPLTYAVQQFFLNGGSQGLVVRVAKGAAAAVMVLRNELAGGKTVLELKARSAGVWGNALRVTIDHDTINPESLFNLAVTEYVASGGSMVAGRSESFRNLTMNSTAPTYAVDTINFNSQLLSATRPGALTMAPTALAGASAGTSESGTLKAPITLEPSANSLALSVDGGPPAVLTLAAKKYTTLAEVATEIEAQAAAAGLKIKGTATANTILFTDEPAAITEASSVHFTPAPTHDASTLLKLGVVAGGIEKDAIAAFQPVPTGTTGKDLETALGAGGAAGLSGAARKVSVTVTIGKTATPAIEVELTTATTALTTNEGLRTQLQAVLQAASVANPTIAAELAGATVAIVDDALVVSAGGRPDAQIAIAKAGTDKTAEKIGFEGQAGNVAAYSPAINAPLLGQESSTSGDDGTAPEAAEVEGMQAEKTGMYALEKAELFNLLVIPEDFGKDNAVIAAAAISYCEARRAMLLLDTPEDVLSLTAAQSWIKDPGTPKSANAAAYFPRALFPDPMQGYRPRPMPTAGAIAGLYARTDSARGVWKAPAGTEATLRGPASLQVSLTDMENGKINPLGLNANRSLPVYGFVTWGARTLDGADVMTSQWKYVPVRRTALYIEESLYRGTQWVVFEPNDEPLWAQVRLSVGGFMQNLFRQHAFQGSSPREAYLVKCDSETTTQTDIDQGIVNILVGFAPLKPAEFVVIQITQLAGQVETS